MQERKLSTTVKPICKIDSCFFSFVFFYVFLKYLFKLSPQTIHINLKNVNID